MAENQNMSLGEPTELCRVFVSRKTDDEGVWDREKIRKELKSFSDKLEFFDAADIKAGKNWRDDIRAELKKANIVLLILTNPASDAFDWPLYEVGLFDSLEEDHAKPVVCIKASETKIPDPIGALQAIEANPKDVIDKWLLPLFTDKSFTNTKSPLNRNVTKDFFTRSSDGFEKGIAQEICDRINAPRGKNLQLELIHPCLLFDISRAIETGNNGRVLSRNDISVSADKETTLANLFGLATQPSEHKTWMWDDIERASSLPDIDDPMHFNTRWMSQVHNYLELLINNRAIPYGHTLSSLYLAKNNKIYAPQMLATQKGSSHSPDRIDITFYPQVHNIWLNQTRETGALTSNLGLAARIRVELVGGYLRKFGGLIDTDPQFDNLVRQLKDTVDSIEHDGFFVKVSTHDAMQYAFGPEETITLNGIERDYRDNIYPAFRAALNDKNLEGIISSLKLWQQNSQAFFEIAVPRYMELLRLPIFTNDSKSS